MFRLSIHMANANMMFPKDIAVALVDVAEQIKATDLPEGVIFDINGNTVGHYKMTSEK